MHKLLFIIALLIGFNSTSLPVIAAETTVCKFGIPPWQKGRSFGEMRKQYMPFLAWMTEQTGCRFVPIGARSYEDLIDKVASGKVHLAEISPASYVLAKRQNPAVNVLVTALMPTPDKTALKDSYLGYIFTLKSNDNINTLQDLKGKTFGFVKKESSSGFKYPNAILQDKGIDYAAFFADHIFLGSHPNVTGAVAAGSIDAGATWQYNFQDAQQQHGDIFKIILQTPPIPNILIASHPNLPAAVRSKLVEVLPNVPREVMQGMPAQGFVVRDDSFYDVVRTVVDRDN